MNSFNITYEINETIIKKLYIENLPSSTSSGRTEN